MGRKERDEEKRNGVSAKSRHAGNRSRSGRAAENRARSILGSGLGFADAFLDALGAAMAAAIKFLGAFDLFMGHEIAP